MELWETRRDARRQPRQRRRHRPSVPPAAAEERQRVPHRRISARPGAAQGAGAGARRGRTTAPAGISAPTAARRAIRASTRPSSVDYAIVLSGEIHALMDEGEVLLKAGDVLIQRGTNHAWSNRTDAPCSCRLRADRRRACIIWPDFSVIRKPGRKHRCLSAQRSPRRHHRRRERQGRGPVRRRQSAQDQARPHRADRARGCSG